MTLMDNALAYSRSDLRSSGMTVRQIRAAVEEGRLVRARRDRYVVPGTPDAIEQAVRVGGRLTCLSLLRLLGVFVHERPALHVHIERGSSRLRSPRDRSARLGNPRRSGVRTHWMPLIRPEDSTLATTGILDALIHAVICQPPRRAIATLDSAVNKRLVTSAELAEVFDALPGKYRVLRSLVDGRAEAGTESLVRLIARSLGCSVQLQVRFRGIGRVDLLLDGWLVVECDSRAHHSDSDAYATDRERDLRLAALGYVTLRLTAASVLNEPDKVAAAISGLLAGRQAL